MLNITFICVTRFLFPETLERNEGGIFPPKENLRLHQLINYRRASQGANQVGDLGAQWYSYWLDEVYETNSMLGS